MKSRLYQKFLKKAELKPAPEKNIFCLKKVKFLEHVISSDGIQVIAKRVKDIQNIKSPEHK